MKGDSFYSSYTPEQAKIILQISKITTSRQHKPHSDYRPDIDGLRAIAVLAVVVFHAFPGLLRGGFVGVDIFFVISGYLISSIILKRLMDDSFSFLEFYSRRIRRIFPSLLVVLSFLYAFGWLLLLPDEFEQAGKHIAGSAAFISNYLFWSEAGYFEADALSKPLLHLWSLGIEEQFYVFFPFLLWLCWKLRLSILGILVLLAVFSLYQSISLAKIDTVAGFYSPISRIWELMAGALLAYSKLHPGSILSNKPMLNVLFSRFSNFHPTAVADTASIVGFSLIVLSVIAIRETDPFPGYLAILPAVGTLLVIGAGQETWINRSLLASNPLVWIGLISYPLYLWHWVLLSFLYIIRGGNTHFLINLAVVFISIALAWMTTKFIEASFRYGGRGRRKASILVIAMMSIGTIGFSAYLSSGYPLREGDIFQILKNGDIGHDEYFEYQNRLYYPCTPQSFYEDALNWNEIARCNQSKPNSPPDVALIGDSHAEHLFLGLADILQDSNLVYYLKASIPIASNPEYQDVFEHILNEESIKTIIISAYWSNRSMEISPSSSFEVELEQTISMLVNAGKAIYLVGDVPTFSFNPDQCKYKRRLGQINSCSEDRLNYDSRNLTYAPAFDSIRREFSQVTVIDIAEHFCGADSCSMIDAGDLLFRDRDHLNIIGSKYLAGKIAGAFSL